LLIVAGAALVVLGVAWLSHSAAAIVAGLLVGLMGVAVGRKKP